MLKEENCVVLNIEINKWARPCDKSRSAACTVYCNADSAYFCAGCDVHVHAASHHERVFVCEACERAPAAFLCKADSASLCVACDTDIHSANPLARRHIRVAILPMNYGTDHEDVFKAEDEEEAASWLLKGGNDNDDFFSYAGEAMEEYLDLGDYSTSCQDNNQYSDFSSFPEKRYEGDSIVPVRNEMKSKIQEEHHYDTLEPGFSYPASISHSASFPNPTEFVGLFRFVSVSSTNVGVVPESTNSNVSTFQQRTPKGTIDLFSSPPMQMPIQLSPMDREARVTRYREKKKNRKFGKTIRYASRKAYAETRPRIKGRFSKRTIVNTEVEVDQMFSASVLAGRKYGLVPLY